MCIDEYYAWGSVLSVQEAVYISSCALPHVWLVPGHQIAYPMHGQCLSMGKLKVGHVHEVSVLLQLRRLMMRLMLQKVCLEFVKARASVQQVG